MPATDAEQERLIRNTIASRHRQLELVTVVNRVPPRANLARVQHAFGVESDRLRVFNNGFVEFVRQTTGTTVGGSKSPYDRQEESKDDPISH